MFYFVFISLKKVKIHRTCQLPKKLTRQLPKQSIYKKLDHSIDVIIGVLEDLSALFGKTV